jgi:hypothetical protein
LGTQEDSGPVVLRVRRNDLNPDGGPMVVESVSDPAHGTVAIVDGGLRVTYQPDPDYCNRGTQLPVPADTFTYTLNGGSTATVSTTRATWARTAGRRSYACARTI